MISILNELGFGWRRFGSHEGTDDDVLIVRATKKLLDRAGPPTLQDGEESTTILGEWYATALFWKPHVVLAVNETTLLPILMPLAPAATVPARLPQQIAQALAAYGAPTTVIEAELRHMQEWRTAKTANRSVVGIMTEFTHLAEVYGEAKPPPSLLDLSARLANTPCSPLYGRNVSPDRELAALLGSLGT
jgi:hypothetical protein